MIFINHKGKNIYVNKRCEEIMGYTKDELCAPDFSFLQLIAPENHTRQMQNLSAHFRGEDVTPSTFTVLTKKETRIEVILNTKLIRYGGKNAVLGILTDITEIKQMENKLRKSLAEKEILLKEIHHRVKNNLQIIHSLLSLQAKYLNDEQDKSLFRQTQDRIKTMALIHEKLYTSQDMVNIDFREYIQNLSAHLLRSYGTASRIELRIEVEKIMLDIDRAVPCSLIINELITNSIKHAFSNGKKSCITIDFSTNKKEYVLSVADNGKGLPDNFDYRNTKSLGLQLVCALTEQLHGNINLGKNKGTKFTITFRKK